MAKFHGILTLLFLLSVLLTEEVGGMDGIGGWVGWDEVKWGGVKGGKPLVGTPQEQP